MERELMSYGHHREELLMALNRATQILELERDEAKKQNEEAMKTALSPQMREWRASYDWDNTHNETMTIVKDISRIIMASKSIEGMESALHAAIQSLLPSYCIGVDDPNEILHLQKFFSAFYSEYAFALEHAPPSELSAEDLERGDYVILKKSRARSAIFWPMQCVLLMPQISHSQLLPNS
jgi:hypothetical protein